MCHVCPLVSGREISSMKLAQLALPEQTASHAGPSARLNDRVADGLYPQWRLVSTR
jgi:hypothetical protein